MLLAGAPQEELARARRMIEVDLRFSAAIDLVEGVLQDPELSRHERVDAYRLLGIAYAAKGKPDSAEAAFVAMLELDADAALDPQLSPKIRSLFEHAQAQVAARPRLTEVSAHPEGGRLTVSAHVEDPKQRVQDVLLFFRFGREEYDAAPMTRSDDRAEAVLTLPRLERVRVEYYLEARDAGGEVLARAGSLEAPSAIALERPNPELTAPPPPPPIEAAPTPWYAEWWVWAIAAGVIGAGVATAVVIDRRGNDGPTGTLDPIHLD